MEECVNSEKALQSCIQQSEKRTLVEAFGEGILNEEETCLEYEQQVREENLVTEKTNHYMVNLFKTPQKLLALNLGVG